MVKQKQGVILAVSSMWGQTGASCESLYSASKGAVDSYVKALAKELGPSGIRVNAVSPGATETDMMKCFGEDDRRAICEDTPVGRLGEPSEIAEMLYFLQSDKASFITGQIIGVNGGYLI
jgi:3-oxoacyl-[acyl-carrier protein] reductase